MTLEDLMVNNIALPSDQMGNREKASILKPLAMLETCY
jgi:hypothetical protein